MSSHFKEWVCVFPGKLGLSWKQAPPYQTVTKEEAETQASQYANSVAVPLQLFEKMKEHERRMVIAEQALREQQCTAIAPAATKPSLT